MNGEGQGPQSWSLRRWCATVLVVAGIQVAAIWYFSDGAPARAMEAEPPRIVWWSDADAGQRLGALIELEDPTVFALAHPQGFSGLAWIKPRRPHAPAYQWAEPPQWLRQHSAGLGSEFSRYAQARTATPFPVVSGLAPRPSLDLVMPNLAPVSESAVVLEGRLGRRGWRQPPPEPLPAWPHTDVLSNSIVEVRVNSAGDVESHRLLSSSGLAAADQAAMDAARRMRFRPVVESGREPPREQAPPEHGRLIFRWQTLPVPPTNSSAGNL